MDSKTETVSDIELIAVFDGWERDDPNAPIEYTSWHKKGFIPVPYEWIAEHYKTWNGIMPIVEKISQIHDSKFKYDVSQIKQGHWPADNEYMEVIALPLATPIGEVYKAVITFIRFYNSQSPDTIK